MDGTQDKRQEPGKGSSEPEHLRRPGQDPVHPGTGREGARGKSPEELKRRREDEMSRERREDEVRDEEL
ncbi:hypothetical protein [Streptomyces sp. NRRL F-2580]|uniref:hypothetical protein n=1 Tax=Streptomyces sp. NRRL F-2580 TaxID=1463841 RepID=UPI000689F911|nr:hypothetical protein [Streptomyces sp. NRRL F-2580]